MNHAALTAPTDAPATAEDPRPAFERAVALAVGLASKVRSDQLEDPTPCSEMNVRELMQHIHMAIARADAIAAGAPLPEEDSSVPDQQWPGVMAAAGAAAIERWSDDTILARVLTLPWMSGPGRDVLAIYLNETLVHAWDLAVSTGQQPEWHDDDAELSLALIKGQLPTADRDELWAQFEREQPELFDGDWAAPFSNAVTVGDDVAPIERLVAWCGRDPS